MAKIVYNACFGGFSLSTAAMLRYGELKGITIYPEKEGSLFCTYWTVPPEQRTKDLYKEQTIYDRDIDRTDPHLVQVVEELGDAANGMCARLRIEEIPDGTLYRIDEYDGSERIMTQDSYDWKIS